MKMCSGISNLYYHLNGIKIQNPDWKETGSYILKHLSHFLRAKTATRTYNCLCIEMHL